MPELPEVETIRGQLQAQLPGTEIVDAWTFGTEKFFQAPQAIGHRITGVRRRGKYLILDLDDVEELIIHLGMTGQLSIQPTSTGDHGTDFGSTRRPPHRRAEWLLGDGRVLEFTDIRRFGRVAVVDRGEHSSLPTLASLGPEPFDETFTAEHLRRAVNSSLQPIKTQLMSQRVVAGLGNIYVDEALWLAGVHPKAKRITKAQASALHDAIRSVLDKGIRNGGTTLRDYRDVSGGSGSNQLQLSCYGRAGLPCMRCGHTIRKTTIAGRTTSFCPLCQRR